MQWNKIGMVPFHFWKNICVPYPLMWTCRGSVGPLRLSSTTPKSYFRFHCHCHWLSCSLSWVMTFLAHAFLGCKYVLVGISLFWGERENRNVYLSSVIMMKTRMRSALRMAMRSVLVVWKYLSTRSHIHLDNYLYIFVLVLFAEVRWYIFEIYLWHLCDLRVFYFILLLFKWRTL
jgi:hypothetical protein